jgi:hypothetical protein
LLPGGRLIGPPSQFSTAPSFCRAGVRDTDQVKSTLPSPRHPSRARGDGLIPIDLLNPRQIDSEREG